MRRPLTVLVAAAAALTIALAPTAASGAPSSSAPSSASPGVSAGDLKLRWGTFSTKKVTGKGTKVIKLPKGAKRGLVTLTAGGKGKVSVQVLKKNRKPQGKALVSTQALPYKGTTLFGLDLEQYDPTYLKVTSTSTKKWKVTIQPLHKAKALKKTHKGSGDAVLRASLTVPKSWSLSYKAKAKSRFAVRAFGLTYTQDLFDKKTKKLSKKVRVSSFSGLVSVRSQGDWKIKR